MFYNSIKLNSAVRATKLIVFLIAIIVLFNSCDKEIFTGYPTEPPAHFGKIFLNSDPPEAEIYINNKNSGYKTPDTIKWLETGNYKVTLKQGLFGDSSFVVDVDENNVKQFFIDYRNNPKFWGKIYCDSKPKGAAIYLNGVNTELTTPNTITKLPGNYTVKLSYPNCREDSTSFLLYGGKTQYVNIILEDTTDWVSYKLSNSQIPSNIISCIAVDKENKKWIGTRDKGVASFDGINWVKYNTKNSSLISDFIYCIDVADDNSIWVGTSIGLSVYRNGVWQNFSESYLNKYITDIAIGKNGDVWISTEVGLAKYNSGIWQVYNTSNSGIAANYTTCVSVDELGNIWVGTNMFGISKFDGSNWKSYNVANMGIDTSIGNIIIHIAADKDNNIWSAHAVNDKAGIRGGLTRFDGSKWSEWTYPGVITNYVESINVDKNNTRWIGTTNGLTEINDQETVTIYNVQNSQIPLGRVTGTVLDNQNIIWVTTLSNGMAKYKR